MQSLQYPTASLKPRREESLLGGHLWIFSGALQQPPHWIERGGLVDIKSATGQFIARGYYNDQTDIAVRILTRDQEEAIDVAFMRKRIRYAQALRQQVFHPEQTNAYRLIHSEGDGLPGLVVDRYADSLVVQIQTAGMDSLREQVYEALLQETGATGILLRNDSQARRREGLAIEEPAVVAGSVPERIHIRENGIALIVDPWQGQKTGFFLDQREKRAALQKYAQRKRVLNCFSYTGGFSVAAALRGAVVTSVDSSEPAIEMAKQNFRLNTIDPEQHQFIVADVFEYLEEALSKDQAFDIVILDPPAFARSQSVRTQALKAYRRLNTLGIQVLIPGGILLTCSCSGVVGMDDLHGILAQSAQRTQRQVQLLESYTHDIDHPIHLAMPETGYLKAIFCRL